MPPAWVIWCCYIAIGLGTMFGGWRIVKTMGQRITKLKPVGGFCAETGGAITLFLATALGIPVSTTHTITGAIVGVGSVRRAAAVRWGAGRQHRLGLDLHDPGLGLRRRRVLRRELRALHLSPLGARLEVALRGERDRRDADAAPTASAITTATKVSQLASRGPARRRRAARPSARRSSGRRRSLCSIAPAIIDAEQRHQQRSRARRRRPTRAGARSRTRRRSVGHGCSQAQGSRAPCR